MKRFSELPIQQRIVVIVVAFVVLTIGTGVFNYVQIQKLRGLQDAGALLADQALQVKDIAALGPKMYQVVADTEINRDFEADAKNWRAVKKDAAAALDLGDKIADTPEEKANMQAIRAAYDRFGQIYELQMVPALKQANAITAEVEKLDNDIDAQSRIIQDKADAVAKSIAAESDAGDKSFDAAAASMTWWMGMIGVVGLVLISMASVVMVRDVSKTLRGMAFELRAGAQQVASASGQVASSSQQLSQGSTQQAASLEETSASMEEMASMTRRNAENSRAAAERMAETASSVSRADAALQDLVSTMTQIHDSSAKVTKIIKTIDEIAFQTNILALNAAVEAARAGEAGMGFAVVADEVRNLAQRSAQAAKDTASLIEESATNARAGGAKVEAVVGAVHAIAESSAVVKGLVDEVSTASHQQAQGIDQVTQAVQQMEKVTQTTAATAEEGAAASEELSAQAEQSLAVVVRLESLVGVGGVAHASSAAPARPRRKATVVPIRTSASRQATPKPAVSSAEAQIPFESTGTFGSF